MEIERNLVVILVPDGADIACGRGKSTGKNVSRTKQMAFL